MSLKQKAFENIVRKGENAGKPAFSPSPTMLSIFLKMSFNRTESHILSSAKALTLYQTMKFRLLDNNYLKLDENGGKFSRDRKHCGKRRYCSLQAIYHSHSVFNRLVQ